MFHTIYQTTNLKTGKIYIGKHSTENLDDGYLGSGKHLKADISKYGCRAFEKKMLYVFTNKRDMDDKENELLTEEFVNRPDTYNINCGNSPVRSWMTKQKISKGNRNQSKSDLHRKLISNALREYYDFNHRKVPITLPNCPFELK